MTFYKVRAVLFVVIAKCVAKIFFIEMPPVVSVAAFIKKDGKLLFLELTYLKGYGLPGGVVQSDETAEEALSREVKEETGLTVTSHNFLGSVTAYKRISMLCLFFLVEASGDIKSSEEGSLVWLDPSEVTGKMAYENVEIALAKFKEDLL